MRRFNVLGVLGVSTALALGGCAGAQDSTSNVRVDPSGSRATSPTASGPRAIASGEEAAGDELVPRSTPPTDIVLDFGEVIDLELDLPGPREDTPPPDPAPLEQSADPAPLEQSSASPSDSRSEPPTEPDPAGTIDGDVLFDTGSSSVSSEGRRVIAELSAQVCAMAPQATIVVTGHTDTRDTAANNLELSRDRANAIAASLEDLGWPSSRLRTRGLGESRPSEPDHDSTGRFLPDAGRRNRRVDIHVLALPVTTDAGGSPCR